MCAIITWRGILPKGLLSQLLLKSERRGHDSTGLAFRLSGSNVSYRQAVPASDFVSEPENGKFMGDARRAVTGLAHTRRASPGMPIDNANAHPFLYWQFFFAHNGKINNWRELQASLVSHFTAVKDAATTEEARNTAQWCVKYCESAKTDSKILGPYIHTENFSDIEGCMALTWLRGHDAFVTRMAKEATSTTVTWRYTNPPEGEPNEDRVVTLVGSTPEIIDDALDAVSKIIEFSRKPFFNFPEGIIYRLEPTGLVVHKKLDTFRAVADSYTSEEVAAAKPAVEVATETTEPPV